MRLDLLTDLMDELARQTWFNLTAARHLGMRMGEVTVTEVNLLAIARLVERSSLNIELVPTRPDEKTTGTDFEIWILNRRGRVFGYSIQAKVIYVHNGTYRYPALGHRNASGLQYDLLERHAMSRGSYPVHLFYNGWDLANPVAPTTPPGRPSELYGCAATMTSVMRAVRRAIGRGNGINNAGPYLARSFPWSDLFRIPEPATSGGGGSGGGTGHHGNGGSSNPGSSAPDGDTPMRPIDPSTDDLDALERRIERLGGEDFERRQATVLPDYITRSRGVPRDQLKPDSDAPLFALLIEE